MKTLIALLVCLMVAAIPPLPALPPLSLSFSAASAAVTPDNITTSSGSGSTTLTWSINCTGTNRVLIVGVSTDAGVDVTGVTHAGTAMTAIAAIGGGTAGLFNRAELFGLIAPATGAQNIIVTVASNTAIIGGGVCTTGADQSTGWGTPATAAETVAPSAAPSVTVTSASGELVVDVLAWGIDGAGDPTVTVGAGQTQRWQDRTQLNAAGGAGSTEAGAASVVMSWSLAASEFWSLAAVPVKAVAAGASGRAIMLLPYPSPLGPARAP